MTKEYFRWMRKIFETKIYSRNLIKGIYIWVFLLVKYLGSFLKWTREELKQMDQSRRKLMMIHKALHLRDDIDRQYVSRKWVRGFTNIEANLDRSINMRIWRLQQYLGKRNGKKNNCMNISCNKQTKSHRRWSRHSLE